jgi:hypothetical protein
VGGVSRHATVVNRVSKPHPLISGYDLIAVKISSDSGFRRIVQTPAELRMMVFRVRIDLSVNISKVSIRIRSSSGISW